MTSIWNALADILNAILSVIFFFLPESPFRDSLTAFTDNEIVQYLNWFIPVADFITMMSYWLAAIALFYAYQLILRWIKAIGD